MARDRAPTPLHQALELVDPRTGRLTDQATQVLKEWWSQWGPGFVVIPCTHAGGQNDMVLTPRLAAADETSYSTGMVWSFVAAASSSAAVTATIAGKGARKVYVSGGASQAGNGDIVSGRLYLLIFNAALDSGAGGFVLK